MEDKIFIPDAVSTADLMNKIDEMRNEKEDFLKYFSGIMKNEDSFAKFLTELFSDESDDEEDNAIMIKFGGVNYVFTAEELAKRVIEYDAAGNYVNTRVLQLASTKSNNLTEDEEMEFFGFISESENFLNYCVQQRKKRYD